MPYVRITPCLLILWLMLGAAPLGAEEATDKDPSGVAGVQYFPGTKAERRRLLRDGVLVLPRYQRQIFQPYIGGALAYYITCDSAHWTFHVLLESALQGAEKAMAADLGPQLTSLHARLYLPENAPPPEWTRAFERASTTLAIAARLTGREVPVPESAARATREELALIQDAAGPATSPLDGRKEDYGDYKPRGFYADDPALRSHFRTVKWLARRGLRIEDEVELRAALLIARAAQGDEALQQRWLARDELLDWLVGPADDLDLAAYIETIGRVTTKDWSNAALLRHLPAIRSALRELPDPEINASLLSPGEWASFRTLTKGLRLFPARRTPDAWLFQTLYEKDARGGGAAGAREPPARTRSGLEVADALGSRRAAKHLGQGLSADEKTGFKKRMGQTFYAESLRTAAILFNEKSALLGAGKPASAHAVTAAPFLKSDAWQDRLLMTGLGSWACLRHAFALHAKTSVNYMGMTRDKEGVVEPTPAYFAALGRLAQLIQTRLDKVGAFERGDAKTVLTPLLPVLEALLQDKRPTPEEMEALTECETLVDTFFEAQTARGGETGQTATLKRLCAWLKGDLQLSPEEKSAFATTTRTDTWMLLSDFKQLMTFLEATAAKEIRGEALTGADDQKIRDYGKELARLNFFGGNSWLAPNRQMGLIIDVASDPTRGTVLEVGIGAAMEIYLVLPDKNAGRRLHIGGVYSYYEFPSETRLDDATWLERIRTRQLPALPGWTDSFVAAIDPAEIVARIEAGESFEEVENIHHANIGTALLAALRAGQFETVADDRHLLWLAQSLEAYASGEAQREIFDLLLRRLLHAPARVGRKKDSKERTNEREEEQERVREPRERNSYFVRRGPATLGRMMTSEDVTRLFDLLENPPESAHKDARARLLSVLSESPREDITLRATQRLSHALAAVRGHAAAVIGSRKRRDGVRSAVSLLLGFLATEQDASNQRRAFEYLSYGVVKTLSEEEARTLIRYLTSPHTDLRRKAAAILGENPAPVAAQALLKMAQSAQDPREAQEALKALGAALHGEGAPTRLRQAALELMQRQLKTNSWGPQVAALEGLEQLGGPDAIAALGAVAEGYMYQYGLRSVAIRHLGELGEGAKPYLYRLLFALTLTGSSRNGHKLRLCDVAADALDPDPGFGPLEIEDIRKRMETYRKKARELGHGPEPLGSR